MAFRVKLVNLLVTAVFLCFAHLPTASQPGKKYIRVPSIKSVLRLSKKQT